MKKATSENSILIIGGGLAGLTAALHLAESGLKPIVLESDPNFLGGRVGGGEEIELDGWHFRGEHGVHGIWSPYRNLQAMLARHNIRPMFVPALEETWIYRKRDKVRKAAVGTAIRYSPLPAPLHYLNLFVRPRFLAMLDIRDWVTLPLVWLGLLWGVGVDPLAENQPLGDMSLDDLVKYWAPTVRAFMIGLSRNGLSATPDKIPLSGFLGFLRFYTLLRRDSWVFSYMPADGGTSLIDPLAEKVQEFGGVINRGCKVMSIEKASDHWKVSGRNQSGEDISYSCENVIIATDSPNAKKIIENSPDLAGADDFHWPRGVETAVIRIWFDKTPKPVSEGGIFTGDFIIDNFFWLHVIQEQYRQWHKETGGSAIEVHVYGPPEVLNSPDALLLTNAIVDVQNAFPELRGHVIHQVLQRNPKNHTVFSVGLPEKHLGIKTPWKGVYCCGDWVRHPAPAYFLERASVTGIFAANEILGAVGIDSWPVLDYPKPEKFVGFIERLMRTGRARRRRRKNDSH
ncbi:FAD-dependent oxidoreductase [Chloroflexota bacterium]